MLSLTIGTISATQETAQEVYLQLNQVPEYLQCGAYFDALAGNALMEEKIPFPSDCIKAEDTVENVEDFRLYLKSLRYWLVVTIPERLVNIALDNSALLSAVVEEFNFYFPCLNDLAIIGQSLTLKERVKVAVMRGCLVALKVLLPQLDSIHLTKELCEAAARYGHLDCLQYLHEHKCPWDEHTCTVAAGAGYLACLQFAHSNGCLLTIDVCIAAAQNNHLHCLQYAHQQHCEWSKVVCAAAALGNSLECLEYLHHQGCPWDIHVTQISASRGHLSCLRFALTNGCPWDTNTCKLAAENGHLACLKLAHQHGCAMIKATCLVDPTESDGHNECFVYVTLYGA